MTYILDPLAGDPVALLTSDKVLEFACNCISTSTPVMISVPTRKGYGNAMVDIGKRLRSAVQAASMDKARQVMLDAIAFGRQFPTEPDQPFSAS